MSGSSTISQASPTKITELVPLAEDGKLTRLDVRCDLSSGEQVDVEVQVLNLKNMRRRTLYYWAQMYLFSLARGQTYRDLKPAITINILAFELLPQKEPLAMYTIMNPETGDELNKDLSLFFVEIPKFAREPKKKISEMTKMGVGWHILPTNSTIAKGRNLP